MSISRANPFIAGIQLFLLILFLSSTLYSQQRERVKPPTDLKDIKRVEIVNTGYKLKAKWNKRDSTWRLKPVSPLNNLKDSLYEHMVYQHFTRHKHAGDEGASTKFLWQYKGDEELYKITTLGAVRYGKSQYFAMGLPFAVGIGSAIAVSKMVKTNTRKFNNTTGKFEIKEKPNILAATAALLIGTSASYWLVDRFYLAPSRATMKVKIIKLKF